jgi:hypothetical protein
MSRYGSVITDKDKLLWGKHSECCHNNLACIHLYLDYVTKNISYEKVHYKFAGKSISITVNKR